MSEESIKLNHRIAISLYHTISSIKSNLVDEVEVTLGNVNEKPIHYDFPMDTRDGLYSEARQVTTLRRVAPNTVMHRKRKSPYLAAG